MKIFVLKSPKKKNVNFKMASGGQTCTLTFYKSQFTVKGKAHTSQLQDHHYDDDLGVTNSDQGNGLVGQTVRKKTTDTNGKFDSKGAIPCPLVKGKGGSIAEHEMLNKEAPDINKTENGKFQNANEKNSSEIKDGGVKESGEKQNDILLEDGNLETVPDEYVQPSRVIHNQKRDMLMNKYLEGKYQKEDDEKKMNAENENKMTEETSSEGKDLSSCGYTDLIEEDIADYHEYMPLITKKLLDNASLEDVKYSIVDEIRASITTKHGHVIASGGEEHQGEEAENRIMQLVTHIVDVCIRALREEPYIYVKEVQRKECNENTGTEMEGSNDHGLNRGNPTSIECSESAKDAESIRKSLEALRESIAEEGKPWGPRVKSGNVLIDGKMSSNDSTAPSRRSSYDYPNLNGELNDKDFHPRDESTIMASSDVRIADGISIFANDRAEITVEDRCPAVEDKNKEDQGTFMGKVDSKPEKGIVFDIAEGEADSSVLYTPQGKEGNSIRKYRKNNRIQVGISKYRCPIYFAIACLLSALLGWVVSYLAYAK